MVPGAIHSKQVTTSLQYQKHGFLTQAQVSIARAISTNAVFEISLNWRIF